MKERFVKPVVVVRPPTDSELLVSTDEFVSLQKVDEGYRLKATSIATQGGKDKRLEHSYSFKHVYGYGGEDVHRLCEEQIEPLLQGCLHGEDAAVIAFGETGSGKSFVCGTEALKASAPWRGSLGSYISRRVFQLVEESKLSSVEISCSMLEIYKEALSREQVFDLLDGFNRKRLARSFAAVQRHVVLSPDMLLGKIQDGSLLRNTDKTDGNIRSSRSHAIVSISINYNEKISKSEVKNVCGTFMIVDLAGAESAAAAGLGSQQQKQGSGINVGLSALQTVINDIASTGHSVQYRMSRLTYELKSALGGGHESGGCNAVFIGCVAPVSSNRSANTLKYIQDASKIKNIIQANVSLHRDVKSCSNCKSLQQKIELLKAQVADGKGKDAIILSNEEYKDLLKKIESDKIRLNALENIVKRADEKYENLLQGNQRLQDQLFKQDNNDKDGTNSQDHIENEKKDAARVYNDTGERPGHEAISLAPLLSIAESTVDYTVSSREQLSPEDICLQSEDTNLKLIQWKTLREIVERALEAQDTGAETNDSGRLQRERTALILVLRAYNEYLGIANDDIEMQKVALSEVTAQLHQAAREKVKYVELTARYMHALDATQNERNRGNVLSRLLRRATFSHMSPEESTSQGYVEDESFSPATIDQNLPHTDTSPKKEMPNRWNE